METYLLVCPNCKSKDVHCIDNLHVKWGCSSCGYQGDGADFDPEEVEEEPNVDPYKDYAKQNPGRHHPLCQCDICYWDGNYTFLFHPNEY